MILADSRLPWRVRRTLAALAPVDYVVVFREPDVRGVIRTLKPDFHVKGTDYTPKSVPERGEVEAYGGIVAIAGDAKSHSSSEIIRRMKDLGPRGRGQTAGGARGKPGKSRRPKKR